MPHILDCADIQNITIQDLMDSLGLAPLQWVHIPPGKSGIRQRKNRYMPSTLALSVVQRHQNLSFQFKKIYILLVIIAAKKILKATQV